MICLMPVKSGHIVHNEVLKGIASQTIPLNLFLNPTHAVHNEKVRECSINKSRNELQRIASKLEDEFVLLLDSDVVMNDPKTVESTIAYMTDGIGCVCVQTKDKLDGHVVAACALIRMSVYKALDYSSTPSICQCSLIALNCNSVYVPNVLAYEV